MVRDDAVLPGEVGLCRAATYKDRNVRIFDGAIKVGSFVVVGGNGNIVFAVFGESSGNKCIIGVCVNGRIVFNGVSVWLQNAPIENCRWNEVLHGYEDGLVVFKKAVACGYHDGVIPCVVQPRFPKGVVSDGG